MNREKTLFMTCVLGMGMFAVVGCDQGDDDLNEYDVSLDVSKRTSLTKSNAMWVEPGSTPSLYDVPVEEDECMLHAIITIATNRRIPITYTDGSGKEIKSVVGEKGFSASQAYSKVKKMATSQNWPQCDVYGNPIPNSESYEYNGGAMSPSVAAAIGKQSGIMEGVILYFESYEQLLDYVSKSSFKAAHPDGSYIISSEYQQHAAIGEGVDSKGRLRYSDVGKENERYKENEQKGCWTLIY